MRIKTNQLLAALLAAMSVVSMTDIASANAFRPIAEVCNIVPRDGANAGHLPATCDCSAHGLRLKCAPEWTARLEGDYVRLRISTDPSVELQLTHRPHRISTGIHFGWAELRALNRYHGWFDMAQTHECGRKILQARGYVNDSPRGRAFDYYLADWEGLYSAQFTVFRAVDFTDYRPLFEEIIDSVEFVTENRDTVNFRAPNDRQCQTITRE